MLSLRISSTDPAQHPTQLFENRYWPIGTSSAALNIREIQWFHPFGDLSTSRGTKVHSNGLPSSIAHGACTYWCVQHTPHLVGLLCTTPNTHRVFRFAWRSPASSEPEGTSSAHNHLWQQCRARHNQCPSEVAEILQCQTDGCWLSSLVSCCWDGGKALAPFGESGLELGSSSTSASLALSDGSP